MPRSKLIVCAGKELFSSFFSTAQQTRLAQAFDWERQAFRQITPALIRKMQSAQALITTWDSPKFPADLIRFAPNLRIIAHCGGEVKSRFARPLFDLLTITAAPGPMARSTAEMGAVFLLYCARNVDFYRDELRRRSNRIYKTLHLHGSTESLIGRQVAMIGFGRIGRALVDLMRAFDVQWRVYDPYASKSLSEQYPVHFVELKELLPAARMLVLTAALTEETRGILNRENLACLPDGAAVINIARGGLIDLQALTREVRSKRLHCALDVTDPLEPLPVGHPLRTLPGAIITPHVAGSGRGVRHEIAKVVMSDLESFFRGDGVENRVTADMLDRMT